MYNSPQFSCPIYLWMCMRRAGAISKLHDRAKLPIVVHTLSSCSCEPITVKLVSNRIPGLQKLRVHEAGSKLIPDALVFLSSNFRMPEI